MKGTYRGTERQHAKRDFRENHVPHYILHEIEPLGKFLFPKTSITALDVGCNKGFWSKALLQRFGDIVDHTYMIDASLENIKEVTDLEDSLLFDPQDFKKMTAMRFAIGEKTGTVNFYTNDDGSPIGSVFPHVVEGEHTLEGMGKLTLKESVPLQTIDNIVSIHQIPRIDIMKIDIEGNEFNALLGAQEAIDSGKIETIMFEFGCHQVDARNFFRDFYEFFKQRGYKMYRIDGLHLYDIPVYGYYLENFTECWNFVASKT